MWILEFRLCRLHDADRVVKVRSGLGLTKTSYY